MLPQAASSPSYSFRSLSDAIKSYFDAAKWRKISAWSGAKLPICVCALLALCIFLAFPFGRTPFNDDWSFSDVALRLAETGHFHYNGWSAPTILFQSIWGAAWIRLAGFSFDLLRWITVPFSVSVVLLTYALGRLVGLSRKFAAFSASLVATSPLFLPLSFSFMTEPYACAFSLLCVYAGIRSADAASPRASIVWLWVLALSGMVGGSDRQSVWIVPVVLLPFLIYKRHEPGTRANALVALIVCLGSLYLVQSHFGQSYPAFELSRIELSELLWRQPLRPLFRWFNILLVVALLSLPALLSVPRLFRKLKTRQSLLIAATCAVLVAALGQLRTGLAPFTGNIMTTYGILSSSLDGIGFKPLLLPRPVQYVLTLLLLLTIGTWLVLLFGKRFHFELNATSRVVFSLYAASYLLLLVPGCLTGFVVDRYALPLLPILAITVLTSVQSHGQRIAAPAILCLIIWAGFGVMTTHDYFATLRARAELSETFLSKGIPRNRFSVGFENDGWAQVRMTGKIRPLRITDDPSGNEYWFWLYTTALDPDFLAVTARADETLQDPVVLQKSFRTWLPPTHRKIAMVRLGE
jgi:hypothetical protein